MPSEPESAFVVPAPPAAPRTILQRLLHPFRLKGRTRRLHYWIFIGVSWLLGFLMEFALAPSMETGYGLDMLIPAIVTMVLGVGLLAASFSFTWRRLQDMDLSGWFAVIPVSLAIVGAFGLPIASGVGGALSVLFGIRPGTTGDNSYGPDPKAQPETAASA